MPTAREESERIGRERGAREEERRARLLYRLEQVNRSLGRNVDFKQAHFAESREALLAERRRLRQELGIERSPRAEMEVEFQDIQNIPAGLRASRARMEAARRRVLRPNRPRASIYSEEWLENYGGAARGEYFWEQVCLRKDPYASHEDEVEIRMGLDTFSTYSAISKGVARRLRAVRTGYATVREMGGIVQHPTTTLWIRVRGCGAAYRPITFMVVDTETNVLGIEAVRACGLLTRPHIVH